jgi:DNA-binding transcriptional MerR regulator
MLIGELSKRSGLSRDTIRFYEKQGLISVGKKQRRFNNYKEYSQSTLERLMQIQRIKGFGFTLTETAAMLERIEDNQASCTHVSEQVTEKVSLIDRKIEELTRLRQQMLSGVDQCQSCCDTVAETENCPIFVSDAFGVKQ